ncbi:MAG: methyltransferase domain-containing protein [Sedimentisphaerales bacterium]|nr:methyltransferase domain-containing protein [Sedimentisphaerales bacterium]
MSTVAWIQGNNIETALQDYYVPGPDENPFCRTGHVYLELSNECNYADIHKSCPVSQLRQNKDILPTRIVCEVLDTLSDYNYAGRIAFHTYNEPLMDPRLFTFIAYARRVCPQSEIFICTNGYYLHQEMADKLVQTGVTNIYVSAYSDSEYSRLAQIRLPIPYHVERQKLDQRLDSYDRPPTGDTQPCYNPLYQLTITASGKICLCCIDWKRQYTFADLYTQPFERAMRNPEMWRIYDRLSKGDRCLGLCKRCRFSRGPSHPEESSNTTDDPESAVAVAQNAVQISFGPRQIPRSDASDGDRLLQQAREAFDNGDYNSAFDIYEQLAEAFPQHTIRILAEAYDQYQRISDRDRYILYQSRHFHFGIRPGDKVLDIGSGGVPFRHATHLADLTVSDNFHGRAGMPFQYLEGRPVYECDLENLPFEDHQFDFVYCSHVLEHVKHPEKACRELVRVAGRGYIETPAPAKDLCMDTAGVSHHLWGIENRNGKLIFTPYTKIQIKGLSCGILRDMACSPQTPREKAFAALVYLKAPLFNTMLLWEGSFDFEVRPSESPVSAGPGIG